LQVSIHKHLNYKFIKIFVLLIVVISSNSKAQNLFVPINNDASFIYEYEVYNKQENFHTSIKPFNISEIKNYAQINNQYKTKKLLNFGDSLRFIEISPIINLGASTNLNNTAYGNLGLGFGINTQITHNLSLSFNTAYNSVYFTNINEFQGKYTPHFGQLVKTNGNSVTYSYFRGYMSYSPGKYFNFQFGKDKNFWGDGYRSILLSDNSEAYWFLKGSVNIWKIKYTILFSSLQDIDSEYGNFNQPSINTSLEDKYSTTHFLSWNIGKRFNFNLFETVIWRGEDSLGYRGFDVNYLNPIVFYRPIEFSLGSPDNVIMGGGFKFKIGKSNHLYGQFILDEFKLAEIKAQNGWWGNKYGFQLGIKTYNLFNIKKLYALIEYNRVRPFTYSHGNSLENWGNYYQSLAHPLGANFTEQVLILKYPHKRFLFKIKTVFSQHGLNHDNNASGTELHELNKYNTNYGGDIYVSYNDRVNEYGNTQNQGYLKKYSYFDISASYIVVPNWNLYFNMGLMNRNAYNGNNFMVYFGFKTNLYNNDIDF